MGLKTNLYRSKKAPDWKVRGVEVTERNLQAVANWINQWHPAVVKERVLKNGEVRDRRIVIDTPLGKRAARPGMMVTRDVGEKLLKNEDGNYYVWFVLDKDTFFKNSELAE